MFGNIRDQMARRNIPAMPGDVSGYGGGTWNGDGTQATPPGQPTGGVFGRPKRKTSQRVAGYLADALSGLAGQQGPYAAMLGQENAQADQEAAYQRQRADQYADWQKRQEYERANRDPGTPYRTEDNAGNVHEMQPDGTFRAIFVDPNDRTFLQDGQMITVPNRVRAGQIPAGNIPAVTDEASYNALPVGAQFRHPDGSTRTKGGPASQAPGGFPLR